MTTRTIQTKGVHGKGWATLNQTSDETALHALAADLAAHYIGKAPYITRIVRTNNYDGSQTYCVYYDNEYRALYHTDIY